jgi:NhaA family Na+:H+ antiporter
MARDEQSRDTNDRRRLKRLIDEGALGGVTLIGGLIAGIAWATIDPSGYAQIISTPVHLPLVPSSEVSDVASVVTNLVMVVFFLAIGLEVARERAVGVLSDNATAALPVVAAIGGMVGAAITYVTVVIASGSTGVLGGWGIPLATDVAFTLGIVALLGSRVPPSLRVFLLTLAVADDVLSVIVLAVTGHQGPDIGAPSLAFSACIALAITFALVVARRRDAPWPVFVLLGLGLWGCLARIGIEPTLAGVVVGVIAPVRGSPQAAGPVLERMAVPISSFLVLPAFAFVAGGVDLGHVSIRAHLGLFAAIVSARLLGKLIGIVAAVFLVTRAKNRALPVGTTWRHMAGAAVLCGMGFTVPLLFATNAFGRDAQLLAITKVALLVASIACAVIGAGIFCRKPSLRSNDG